MKAPEFEPMIAFVTCGSEEEAYRISKALVEGRLAACVNILSPVRSIYRWEGKMWDEKECLLVIKTQKKHFELIEKKVKSLHSYSVPEIIGLTIEKGDEPYLSWLYENTSSSRNNHRD